MAVTVGDIAIGGAHGYAEVTDSAGTLKQMVHVHDDLGAFNQTFVTGVTWRPLTNELFTVSTPDLNQDNSAHDVDWFPNDSGLLIAVVPTTGSLIFRKTDFDGVTVDEWSGAEAPDTDVGFGRQLVRISIACDSRTVFYTDMGRTIFRYDLTTRANIAPYSVLSDADYASYLYGGIRVLPVPLATGDLRQVIVAMTRTGTGPQRAVALSSATQHWVDQINPPGSFLIQQRLNADGTATGVTITTQADEELTPTNDYTLSLAVNVPLCAFPALARYPGKGLAATWGPSLV